MKMTMQRKKYLNIEREESEHTDNTLNIYSFSVSLVEHIDKLDKQTDKKYSDNTCTGHSVTLQEMIMTIIMMMMTMVML